MRPRKKILLVSADEEGNQVRRYDLWTHRYDVKAAGSAAEALEQLHGRQFDLLLCELPLKGVQSLLKKAPALNPELKTILLTAKPEDTPSELFVNAILPKYTSVEQLLEHIKLRVNRKRGPKKAPTVDRMMELAERRIA